MVYKIVVRYRTSIINSPASIKTNFPSLINVLRLMNRQPQNIIPLTKQTTFVDILGRPAQNGPHSPKEAALGHNKKRPPSLGFNPSHHIQSAKSFRPTSAPLLLVMSAAISQQDLAPLTRNKLKWKVSYALGFRLQIVSIPISCL